MDRVKIYRGTAKLKETELFYLDTGTDGPAVICLHGRWGRAETWYEFMQRYGGKYRIVAPDQRGHGLSGKPETGYSAEEMAGDVWQFMNALDIGRAVIVGHSMGAKNAAFFAAMHPERTLGLAILDKSASASRFSKCRKTGGDPLTGHWPMPFATYVEAADYIWNTAGSVLSYRYFMSSLTETAAGFSMMFDQQAMAANAAEDLGWFELLPQISCPVLLLRALGGDVSNEDFTRMQSLIPDCLAREISHPDHLVYLSDPEAFYKCFDELLEKL